MGPHSFKCGSSRSAYHSRRTSEQASMGPHSFKCGSYAKPAHQTSITEASMGPHSFKCGSLIRTYLSFFNFNRFNGAALFQVRKFQSGRPSGDRAQKLQWGRTLSSAEVSAWQCPPATPTWPQWGRTLSSAEVCGPQTGETRAQRLQWGRTLSSAEVTVNLAGTKMGIRASMGPHSFKCGSCPRSDLAL